MNHRLRIQMHPEQHQTAGAIASSTEPDVFISVCFSCARPVGLPIAFFNHSCNPNVSMTLAPRISPQRITFRAVRAIEEGTEISMTYVDVCLPRSERRQQLYHNYLFDCTCSMCTESSAQATANRTANAANAGDMTGDGSSVALEGVEQVEL